jgi:hypothetical protein
MPSMANENSISSVFAETLISLFALLAFIKFNRTLKACSPVSQWQEQSTKDPIVDVQ